MLSAFLFILLSFAQAAAITLNPKEHPVDTRYLEDCSATAKKPCVAEMWVLEWSPKKGYVKTADASTEQPQGRWRKAAEIVVIEILPPDS